MNVLLIFPIVGFSLGDPSPEAHSFIFAVNWDKAGLRIKMGEPSQLFGLGYV